MINQLVYKIHLGVKLDLNCCLALSYITPKSISGRHANLGHCGTRWPPSLWVEFPTTSYGSQRRRRTARSAQQFGHDWWEGKAAAASNFQFPMVHGVKSIATQAKADDEGLQYKLNISRTRCGKHEICILRLLIDITIRWYQRSWQQAVSLWHLSTFLKSGLKF